MGEAEKLNMTCKVSMASQFYLQGYRILSNASILYSNGYEWVCMKMYEGQSKA